MLVEKQTFQTVKIVGSDRTFAGLDLERCEFVGSHLTNFDDPGLGLVVRDVVARRCVVKRSGAHGVRFEELVVEGLTGTASFLEGCVFRHVTLRGRAGSLTVKSPNPGLDPEVREGFADSIAKYYRDVDWALDISEAEFDAAELFYVPGDLVRRDPETQFLIRRAAVAGVDRATLPGFARAALLRLRSTPFDSMVAVAPRRSKDFAEAKAHLQELRDRGLAE